MKTVLLWVWHHPLILKQRTLFELNNVQKEADVNNKNVYTPITPENRRKFESLREIKDLKNVLTFEKDPNSVEQLDSVHFSLLLSIFLAALMWRLYIRQKKKKKRFLVCHKFSNGLFTTFCLFLLQSLCLFQPMCGQRGNERKCSATSNPIFPPGWSSFSADWSVSWLKSPWRRPWHSKLALVGGHVSLI